VANRPDPRPVGHARPLGESREDGHSQPVDRRPGLHLPLFLAYGVTGVRNMNDGTADVTLELTNTIKRQLAEGSRRGPPRFLSAGPVIDGDPYLASKEGHHPHSGGGSGGGGTAGLEWRRSHQGLRERLQGGLLRDHRRGATDVEIPLGAPGLSLHEELIRLVEAA
jgi:hypothetical protein